MTEVEVRYPPPWLTGPQAAPEPTVHTLPAPLPSKPRKPGNPAWTPGMKSPNPAGRPKGIVDKRQKLNEQMLADAQNIVSALIDKALEGDTGAASLILARVLPSLRSQAERVTFEFDASAPVVRQVEQVLAAIAAGAVAPDVGRLIIEAIGSLSAIRATEELKARLAALERENRA